MPDVLAINVPDGRGGTQVINVAVERPEKAKAYIGGYKHIQTGEYFTVVLLFMYLVVS